MYKLSSYRRVNTASPRIKANLLILCGSISLFVLESIQATEVSSVCRMYSVVVLNKTVCKITTGVLRSCPDDCWATILPVSTPCLSATSAPPCLWTAASLAVQLVDRCDSSVFCDLEALAGLFWATVMLHKLCKHCTEFCIIRMNKNRKFPTNTLCFRRLFSWIKRGSPTAVRLMKLLNWNQKSCR